MSIRTICHMADIHIRKIPTRNAEYEKVFASTIKSLKKAKPDRIVIGGDLVHDYLDLQSEQIIIAAAFLNNLADIAPVVITMGNHDFRRKNSKRVDSVAAIVSIINNPKVTYYNKTGLYPDDNVMWAVWHHGQANNNPWKTKDGKKVLALKSESGYTHIDLFHDPINGCKTPTGFEMKKRSYYSIKDFQGDYTLLGDIHLQQYFHNKTKAYCGSLIAQDFSEGDDQFHGYLLWDIETGNVKEIPIANDYSFKNLRLSTYTDFADLDYEIDDSTKFMKIRIVWGTLPSARNKENEGKIIGYIKNKYPEAIISHKNDFAVDDNIDIDESITVEDITQQTVQHEIFTEYLAKIGLVAKEINDVLALDDEITTQIDIEPITHIEWSVMKFGAENFMSYQNIDIDWRNKDGLYQITGDNTAGKTTILKLISYILFNKTLETENRVKYGDTRFVNNKTDLDYCTSYLVLEANGEYYGIKRRTEIERKKDGTVKGAPTKVDYFILTSPDDEMVLPDPEDETVKSNSIDALTEDNKKATQKKIDEIIGTYDNYMRVVMTTADTLNRILSNDMATFIDSLLFDSGLDVFDKKLGGVKKHIADILKGARVSCNVEVVSNEITALAEKNVELQQEVLDLTNTKLPDVQGRIDKGDDYVEELTKKLFKIDPEIADLDVDKTNDAIGVHAKEILLLSARQGVLEKAIKPLKETYDEEKLTQLEERKNEHKQSEYDLKLESKEFERKKGEEGHKIEIENGFIHVAKESGAKNKKEILELRESKTCPTCGQLLTEEHRVHVDEKIKEVEKVMFGFVKTIKEHQKTIDETLKPKVSEYQEMIQKNSDLIEKMSLEMETILVEIGELTNDKNDVEKRKEHQTELDQIPTKIQNEELKKSILETKVQSYNNSIVQIAENVKINSGITKAKERLIELGEEKSSYSQSITIKNGEMDRNTDFGKEKEQLITDFEKQEYQDSIMETYKKCVHRDGIPRQLLSNIIIPKINVEMENILSVAPFKVWVDNTDLRPKLAYYNTQDAIIDAIGSSGKERTFASIVLKEALNEINVKSKPTMFLLDEVMGKLKGESIEEFVMILQLLKEKCKKLLIVEPTHEVNPDYLLAVERTEGGISSMKME